MAGHGSTAGLMAYGDANAVAMEIGEHGPASSSRVPVICGVHASDPRRRMWHWLLKVKDMGFSGVNNFPTHCIVDGQFRQILEETGMSVKRNSRWSPSRTKWTSSRLSTSPRPTKPAMAEAGADAIIAHVGTTIGGSIGVKAAAISLDDAVKRVQAIVQGGRRVRKTFSPLHMAALSRRPTTPPTSTNAPIVSVSSALQPGAARRRKLPH